MERMWSRNELPAGLAPSVGPCTWGYSGHGQEAGYKSLLTPLRSLGQGWGRGKMVSPVRPGLPLYTRPHPIIQCSRQLPLGCD